MVFNKTTLACSLGALLALNSCTRTDPTPINNPPTVNFDKAGNVLIADAIDPEQDPLTYSWVIDGVPYSGSVVSLPQLAGSGEVSVSLTVSDGVNTASHFDTVDFGKPENNLNAVISASTTGGDAPLTVVFNSNLSTDESDDIVSYAWDFNGDGLTDSNNANPSFVFTTENSYNVSLAITDGDGNTATDNSFIVVQNGAVPPVAVASATPTSGQAPLSVRLDGSGSSDDGSIVTYKWSLGQDEYFGQTTEIIIDDQGTYRVFLEVTDNDGLVSPADYVEIQVSAPNQDPVANIVPSVNSGEAPLMVSFDASGSTDDGTISSYSWEIEGMSYTGVTTPSHNFTTGGDKSIRLTVTDDQGSTGSTILTYTVDSPNGAPVAVAVASATTGQAPVTIDFDGSGSTDDNGISLYSWSINGATFQQESFSYEFTVPGTFIVELSVTDADGLRSTDDLNIVITAPNSAPNAVITAPQTSGVSPLTLSINASSSSDDNGISSYKWEVDDQELFGETLDYTFNDVKNYLVVLTVTDADGLTDTDSVVIAVQPDTRPVGDVLPAYDGVIPLIKMIGDPTAELQTDTNPFSDSYFYASPDVFHAINETSLNFETESQSPDSMYQKMKYTQRMPSAVWMDSIATIHGSADRRSLEEHLDAALAQQQDYQDNYDMGAIAPMNIVVIIYNLPDRDCAALASSGLLVEVGDDTKISDPEYLATVGTGLDKYQTEYIDVIADLFDDPKYDSLRIVAMLEPDSYPNMISNQNPNVATDAYCIKLHDRNNDTSGQSGVYTEGLRYAVKEFAADNNSNVYTYIDIGHSGWLGWEGNRDLAVNGGTSMYWNVDNEENDAGGEAIGFTNLVDGADGVVDGQGLDMIRGFASNTSGYTPLFEPYFDGTNAMSADSLYFEWNPMVDELHFMETLDKEFQEAGFGDNNLGFIIDTARNGWGKDDATDPDYNRPTSGPATKDDDSMAYRVDKRTQRGRWCNVMDAGVGESPQADPLVDHPWIDAFYWMKPPGESDGSSNPTDANAVGKSYDPVCGGVGTPKTGMVPGRVIGNAAGLDTRTDTDSFYAPTAGLWFDEQYRMLIDNAYPPLGEIGSDNNDYDAYDYDTAIVPATP